MTGYQQAGARAGRSENVNFMVNVRNVSKLESALGFPQPLRPIKGSFELPLHLLQSNPLFSQ